MGSGRRSGIRGPDGISLAFSGSSAGRNSGGGAYSGMSSSLRLGVHTGWLGTRAGLTKSASRSGVGRDQVAMGALLLQAATGLPVAAAAEEKGANP